MQNDLTNKILQNRNNLITGTLGYSLFKKVFYASLIEIIIKNVKEYIFS
jgi:hypothetical protein